MTNGVAKRPTVSMTASPISRMGTSTEDGWRESSRPRGVRPREWRREGGRAARSLDYLVRPQQQCLRDREPQRLRGLEIDEELELGRLLDRQIAGLGLCLPLIAPIPSYPAARLDTVRRSAMAA